MKSVSLLVVHLEYKRLCFKISQLLWLKDFQVGFLSTLYFIDGIGPFGGSFFLQDSNTSGVFPPTFTSKSNVVGINWATANATAKGWSITYNVNLNPEQKDLIVLDSSTSTLILAFLSTLIAFGSVFLY